MLIIILAELFNSCMRNVSRWDYFTQEFVIFFCDYMLDEVGFWIVYSNILNSRLEIGVFFGYKGWKFGQTIDIE